MKNKILATLGAASFALAISSTASHALLGFEPGENVGLATGSPLPEGVFAVDDELYGKRDGNPGHTGLNIPELIWATPFTFYNTRLEFASAFPVFHSDSYAYGRGAAFGAGGIGPNVLTDDETRVYNLALGVLLAHDFGGGFGGSIWGLVHPANERFIPHTWADMRAAISYTGNGFDLTAQFGYTGTFGSHNSLSGDAPNAVLGVAGISDAVNVDLTATKKFGKFEFGFVGFAHTDIENGIDNMNATLTGLTAKNFGTVGYTRAGAVAVGGLIGYDFGKFVLQADVTREVAARGAPQVFTGTGKETRGLVRITVPLYVAPAPTAPVVARY